MTVYVSSAIYLAFLCFITNGLSQGPNGLTTAAASVWVEGGAACKSNPPDKINCI